jgi:hypothetical protein
VWGKNTSGYRVPASSKQEDMKFSDLEALQAFDANEELTEERRQAGAVIESGVMTMMAEDEFLTNFSAPFTVD